MDQQGPSSTMPNIHHEIKRKKEFDALLDIHRTELVENIDLTRLYDNLIGKKLINEQHRSKCQNSGDEYKQKGELIDLMKKKPIEQKLLFCDALRETDNGYLVEAFLTLKETSTTAYSNNNGEKFERFVGDCEREHAPTVGEPTNNNLEQQVTMLGKKLFEEWKLTFKSNLYNKAVEEKEEIFSSAILKECKNDDFPTDALHSKLSNGFNAVIRSLQRGCVETVLQFFHSSDVQHFVNAYIRMLTLTHFLTSMVRMSDHDIDDQSITVPELNQENCEVMIEDMKRREKSLEYTVSDSELDEDYEVKLGQRSQSFTCLYSLGKTGYATKFTRRRPQFKIRSRKYKTNRQVEILKKENKLLKDQPDGHQEASSVIQHESDTQTTRPKEDQQSATELIEDQLTVHSVKYAIQETEEQGKHWIHKYQELMKKNEILNVMLKDRGAHFFEEQEEIKKLETKYNSVLIPIEVFNEYIGEKQADTKLEDTNLEPIADDDIETDAAVDSEDIRGVYSIH